MEHMDVTKGKTMRIVQLTGFSAKAEVLGFILPVQYNGMDKTLVIGGVDSVQMASDLLERLADKSVAVVGLPTDGAPVPAAPAKAPAKTENTKIAEAVKASMAAVAAVDTTPAQAAPAAAAQAPAPVPQAAPPAPAAPVSAAPAGVVPADLNVNTTFRDLIIYLRDKGVTEAAAVVAECERLKPTLPALQRISDIPDRVARALSRK